MTFCATRFEVAQAILAVSATCVDFQPSKSFLLSIIDSATCVKCGSGMVEFVDLRPGQKDQESLMVSYISLPCFGALLNAGSIIVTFALSLVHGK